MNHRSAETLGYPATWNAQQTVHSPNQDEHLVMSDCLRNTRIKYKDISATETIYNLVQKAGAFVYSFGRSEVT